MAERVFMMDCADGIRRADNGSFAKGPTAKTSSYTIPAALSGTLFTNKGAGGAVTFTLPKGKGCMWFMFFKMANQNLLIKPYSGQKIGNGTADYVYKNTASESGTGLVSLVFDGNDNWFITRTAGTWSSASS